MKHNPYAHLPGPVVTTKAMSYRIQKTIDESRKLNAETEWLSALVRSGKDLGGLKIDYEREQP